MRCKKSTHRYFDAWQFQLGQQAPDWVNELFAQGHIGFTSVAAQEIRVHRDETMKPGDWLLKEVDDRLTGHFMRTDEAFRLEFTEDPDKVREPQDFAEGIAAGLADFEQAEKR